ASLVLGQLPAAGMSAAIDVQGVTRTVAASVRYMTASVMSLTDEGRPIGDRLSITSFGVSRWSGVSTTPGATALTRMPSFAYSIARCWVIVSRPPLVIIGTAAMTPRIGLRARAAVIVTMLPPVFCANMCLIDNWVTYRKPSTFVETSDLKSSAV